MWLFLTGSWFGRKKPRLLCYLEPFPSSCSAFPYYVHFFVYVEKVGKFYVGELYINGTLQMAGDKFSITMATRYLVDSRSAVVLICRAPLSGKAH